MATVDENGLPVTCAIDMMDSDENGLYFLTAKGKGFYDRLLADTDATKVGVAYDFQLVDEIDAEPHDVKVDVIITESRLITVRRDKKM